MERPTARCSIMQLNDAFRTTFVGGRVMMTAGIAALPPSIQVEIIARVRGFTAFTTDSDPHSEHDFGALDVAAYKIFWKIDYLDPTMTCGSDDPADEAKTVRVLTIMLAEEY